MNTEEVEFKKGLEPIAGGKESAATETTCLTELEYDTVLLGLTVGLGIVYLYLAMAMFHASYFLLLLDSPDERESFWVHTLAWIWRHGILVLVTSFLLGWDMSLNKDNRPRGIIILILTFPIWITCVLLFTLFVDAVDMFVIHNNETNE